MNIRKNAEAVAGIVANGASDIVGELADAARKSYCKQYTENPYWVMARNNLIVPIVTRTLNNFCSDSPPPPPPPPPPFTGGQCGVIEYTMVLFAKSQSIFGGDPVDRTINAISVFGEVISVEYDDSEAVQNVPFVCVHSGGNQTTPYTWNLSSSQRLVPGTVRVEFVRVDGEVDECGDPPSPGYDPTPPPNDDDLTTTVNVTNNQGDSYDYNVTINRDPGGTIVFPPSINVSGVAVSIDIGGITVGSTTINVSGGGGGSDGDTFSPEGGEPSPELVEEEQPEEEEPPPKTVDKLVAVVINLTNIPVNADVTDGRGAPDIYYAGWIEFKNKGTYYSRQFINFASHRFQAPEENDGYAVTYRNGFSGAITEILEEVVE